MNKSTHQVYQDSQNCCCCCSQKEQFSKGRDKKYPDGFPIDGYESEDGNRNCICNFQSLKINNGQRFAHDDLYDNLVDLIDNEMMCTMSNLRKKARKFIKSEMDNVSSDAASRPCTCPEEIRTRGANVTEKAKTINYQPQSNFLQKMKQYYQSQNNELSDVDNRQNQEALKRSPKPKRKQQSNSKHRSVEKRSGETFPKGRDSRVQEKKSPVRKSEHISRPKKPTKGREKRKRFFSQKSESSLVIKLEPPHENSCERCWRYASPSRSPVNKPDQRYDPNFRRGHSCEFFGNLEELKNEKGNYISPCKNLQPLPVTVTKKENSPAVPQIPAVRKSVQNFVQTPGKNYSPQFIPFRGRGTSPKRDRPSKSPTQESRAGAKGQELAFDWPLRKSPTTPSQIDQMVHQTRPHTYEKTVSEDPRDIEFMRSIGRNRVKRPQTYSPGACRTEDYPNILDIETYRDICGATNLDPCIARRPFGNEETTGLEIRDCSSGRIGAKRRIEGGINGGTGGTGGTGGSGGTGGTGGRDGTDGIGGKDGRDSYGNKDGIGSREGGGGTGSKEGGINAMYSRDGRGIGSRNGRDGRGITDDKGSKGGIGSLSGREGYLSDDTDNLNKSDSRAGTKGKGAKKSGKKNKNLLSSAASVGTNGIGGSDFKKSKKTGTKTSPKQKSPSRAKTPKNKSPPKTPKDSPQSAKDKKGSSSPRDEVNKNVPQSEISSYFKLPEKNQACYDARVPCSVDICGGPQPSRECHCFPRPTSDNGKSPFLSGHCTWKEPRKVSFDQVDSLGYGGRCTPPPAPSEPPITPTMRLCPLTSPASRLCQPPSPTYPCPPGGQTSRPCPPCRGLPNFREYPEQLYGETSARAYTDRGVPQSYTMYPNVPTNPPKYQQVNECVPVGVNTESPLMNGKMNFPRKYCVFYMFKGDAKKKDDVEVLVEELNQTCPKVNGDRMTDVCKKMKRVSQCQNESMALKFEKNVSECPRPPESSRVLYF